MENNIIKKELQEIAPELGKLEKENPFSVPVDYFENLPSQVQERIVVSRKKSLSPGFYSLPRLAFAGFTAVMLLLAGYLFLLRNPSETTNGFADEIYMSPQMEWYAEYQSDVYYEIILDEYETHEIPVEDSFEEDPVMMDYLIDYGNFFMDAPYEDDTID